MKKVLLPALLCALVLTGCGSNKKPNEEPINEKEVKEQVKANVNQGVIEDKTVGEFNFTNTSMILENNETKFETTATNISTNEVYVKEFSISVKDAEGNVLTTFKGFVDSKIQPGTSKIISSNASIDLTNAASISYEIVR